MIFSRKKNSGKMQPGRQNERPMWQVQRGRPISLDVRSASIKGEANLPTNQLTSFLGCKSELQTKRQEPCRTIVEDDVKTSDVVRTSWLHRFAKKNGREKTTDKIFSPMTINIVFLRGKLGKTFLMQFRRKKTKEKCLVGGLLEGVPPTLPSP